MLLAVIAVAVLVVSGMPIPAQGTDVISAESGYSGESHVVRYHLNYDEFSAIIKAATKTDDGAVPTNGPYSHGNGSGDNRYVDVLYYGSIVSTEYNPQLWKSTIVTPTSDDNGVNWNWLPITDYVVDKTVVFTGWRYGWETERTETHYAGEVMSAYDLSQIDSDGVLNVYATWGTVRNVGTASTLDEMNAVRNGFSGGDMYTNFLLIRKSTAVSLDGNTFSASKPMTIRTEPAADNEIARFEGKQSAAIQAGAPLTIDGIGFRMNTSEKHGTNTGGVSGCGYPLIIGTGIMSYYSDINLYRDGGKDFDRSGYASLRGGTTSGDTSGNWPVNVYPNRDTGNYSNIASVLIVHSGTWANIIGGNRANTTNGSTYSVLRSATVLDTYACGGTGSGNNSTKGSTFGYLVNANLVADSFEQNSMGVNTIPYKFTPSSTIPAWPYIINEDANGNNIKRALVFESTVLTGGGGSGSNGSVSRNTNVFISGTSIVWDAQAAGRSYASPVSGISSIELSGKATCGHVLCGSSTDGSDNANAVPCAKNTKVTVKDSAKAATVCGGGYDTWSYPQSPSMYDGGSTTVLINGGTVCDVYGGGYRADVGKQSKPIDSITVKVTGGTVLGSVYGGGSGGLDKLKHNENGTLWFQTPAAGRTNTTGTSTAYVRDYIDVEVSGDAHVMGSVYGGGKSTPAIKKYNGTDYDTGTDSSLGGRNVASVICDKINVTVGGQAVVEGDLFGSGRGVKTTSTTVVAGLNETEFAYITTMTPSGERKYIEWISDGSTTTPLSYEYRHTNTLYDTYAKVTTTSGVHVTVKDDAVIGSCVFGAGERGAAQTNTDLQIRGGTVNGSIYGGGLAKAMTGNTNVVISGNARILASVYGGGDIGVRDQSSTSSMQTLVNGNSNIMVDGSHGASIAMSILGGGNSCLVSGTRTVVISDYVAPAQMESLHSATTMDIIRSSMYLDGRGIGATSSPSMKYSLYDIGVLRMIDGSKLRLSQAVDEVREYGSYIANGELTTMSNPSNTIMLSGGIMFNTGYYTDAAREHRGYGLISGYTILSKDIADEFYGAYAFGSQDSTGHFVQTKDGTYEVITFVDKEGESFHDPFRLWTLSGSVKRNMVMVATYNGSPTVVEPSMDIQSEDLIRVVTEDTGRNILFTGATVSLEAEADLVSDASGILDSNDICIVVGYEKGGHPEYTCFNLDSTTNKYVGVPITQSFAKRYVGNGSHSVSTVTIGMWYRGDIPFTGDIGRLNLEFQEVVPISVDNMITYAPICKTEIVVNLYCVTSTSIFAGANEEDYVHQITIPINEGSGTAKLVIPSGYVNSRITLANCTIYGNLDLSNDLEMHTAVSVYGTSGWVGAVGKGGSVRECIDSGLSPSLSGSFNARINFDAENITEEKITETPRLHFTITNENGNKVKFILVIKFEEMRKHTVEFYTPKYDANLLKSLSSGQDVTVIPPLHTLAGSCTVLHGSTLSSTVYPTTYDYFQGWYLDPNHTKYFDTTSEITEDMKLYGRYNFKAMFHLNGATYETYYEDIVSKNIARLYSLYEDRDVSVQIVYHYQLADGTEKTSTITRHLGDTYGLPDVSSFSGSKTEGFKGWLLDSKVYGAEYRYTVYSTQIEFTAVYEDEDVPATVLYVEYENAGLNIILEDPDRHYGETITLPLYTGNQSGEFIGWVYNASLYHPGTSIAISDEHMVFYALCIKESSFRVTTEADITAHPGSEIYLPVPADTEGFRGWMLGGAFYYLYGASDLSVTAPAPGMTPEEIYAHSEVAISLNFSDNGPAGDIHVVESVNKRYGEGLKIPSPNFTAGFVGWYSSGRVYQPGDLYVAIADVPAGSSSTSVDFVAMYSGSTGNSHVLTVPDSKIGVMDGRVYQSGETLTVPNTIVDWDSVIDGTGYAVDLTVPTGREDFRGWKVGDAYYYIEDRTKTYVVSDKDEVAVPVYYDKSLPALIKFSDRDETWSSSYGDIITLPAPRAATGFQGWYHKGFVFPAGYTYIITDELTEFTAMHYVSGGSNNDCRNLTVRSPTAENQIFLYVLHGNIYTEEEARTLFVPNFVEGWDGEPLVIENGKPIMNTEVTVHIDFGKSMNGLLTHIGDTVELPYPVYEDGFKGWLAGGELYKPRWNVPVSVHAADTVTIRYPILDNLEQDSSRTANRIVFWLKDAYGQDFSFGPVNAIARDDPASTFGSFFTVNEPGIVIYDGYYEVTLTVSKDLWTYNVDGTLSDEDQTIKDVISEYLSVYGEMPTVKVYLRDMEDRIIDYGEVFLVPVEDHHESTGETLIKSGTCTYSIQERYSYLRPISVSDEMLQLPGYYTDGMWYDDKGRLRFYQVDEVGERAGEYVDDIDNIVDDREFNLNWIGKKIDVIPLIIKNGSYERLKDADNNDYKFEVTYDKPYGRPVTVSTNLARAALGTPDDHYLGWILSAKNGSSYTETDVRVYNTSIVNFLDYDSIVTQVDGKDTIYIVADESSDTILVHLYSGEYYVPQKPGNTIVFEAMFEPLEIPDSEIRNAVFDINNTGFSVVDGAVVVEPTDIVRKSCYGGTVVVPVPVDLTNFIGWLHVNPRASDDAGYYFDDILYTYDNNYIFTDVPTSGSDNNSYFVPLYIDESKNGSVKFTIDTSKGIMKDYPEDSSVVIDGHIGQTIALPEVESQGSYKFVGWVKNNRIVYEHVLQSPIQKELVALFEDLSNPGTATFIFKWDGSKGVYVGQYTSVITGLTDGDGAGADPRTVSKYAVVGESSDLPAIAPMMGYNFSGWKVVNIKESGGTVINDGRMAHRDGIIDPPDEFNVIADVSEISGKTTYTFKFNDGQRVGYYLSGWDYLEYPKEHLEEYYIPLDNGKVVFKALFEPIDKTGTTIYRGVFDTNNNGIFGDAGDYVRESCYGGKIYLKDIIPDDIENFVAWVTEDNFVYPDKYVFTDVLADENKEVRFKPLYLDKTKTSSVTFTIKEEDRNRGEIKGHVGEYTVTITGYVGEIIDLPEVLANQGHTFIGWTGGHYIRDNYAFLEGVTETLTAVFALENPREVAFEYSIDESNGHITSGTPTATGHVGEALILPNVQPEEGYIFTGWMIQTVGTDPAESIKRMVRYYPPDNHIYTMGETVTVEKVGDEYRLYYMQDGVEHYYVTTDTIEFEAVWKKMEFTVEIQAPSEGVITYWLSGEEENAKTLVKGDETAVLTVEYGGNVEFRYDLNGESSHVFYRWGLIGEGEVVLEDETTRHGILDVVGDANVSAILKFDSGCLLTVYKPAKGSISFPGVDPLETYSTFDVYQVLSGSEINLVYVTDTDDEIYGWYINNMFEVGETVEFFISEKTVIRPYLKQIGAKTVDNDVYVAFPQNSEGKYVLSGIPGLVKSTVAAGVHQVDGDHMSVSYEWVAIEGSDDWNLVLTLNGAEDNRGRIDIDVTIDDPEFTKKFKVHVMIVGPLADGNW